MSGKPIRTLVAEYLLIALGSVFYGVSTVLFIFPHGLLIKTLVIGVIKKHLAGKVT